MLDSLFESLGGLGGWALALGVAVVAGPTVARGLRPVAKGAIKGYLALTDRAREATAETKENLQDLVAEARSEYRSDNPTTNG